MREKLIELKKLREGQEILRSEMIAKQEEFDQENIELIAKIGNNSDLLSATSNSIKMQAVEIFNNTPKEQRVKTLEYGVKIQERVSYEYDDVEALRWAKEHQLCLSLDKASFKKIAKSQELEFVSITEKISATIPQEIKVEE